MIIGADSTDKAGANPFWDFSLALYVRPGVSEACLGLQDEHGLDVNLLLYCVFASACGIALSPQELAAAQHTAGDWRREILLPLRALRRRAGEQFAEEATRRALLEAELQAERVQQDALWRSCCRGSRWTLTPAPTGSLSVNLALLAQCAEVPEAAFESLLALLEAVLPVLVAEL